MGLVRLVHMAPVSKPKPKLRKHFLKEWRMFRGLTQEQAESRLGMDRSNLSRIEASKIPYSQGLLEAAAEAYGCEPWDILNVNPFMAGDVVDLVKLLKDADPAERAEIIGFARGRLRAG